METYRQHVLKVVERLPGSSLWLFVLQQAWAALFGGLMLAALVITHYYHLPWFARYDWLFISALAIQAFMLISKLEKPYEVLTIVAFHLVGLGMEIFKTSSNIGSWSYPGEAFFHVANVPLFSGFMYAAVGSYLARAWRVFELRFTYYPPRWTTLVLASAIYLNFFTHHYVYDIRYVLFVATFVLYGRTAVLFIVNKRVHSMPLSIGFILIAFFIWLAENIATYTSTWFYPSQLLGWHMVSPQKIGSWLLLMIISFILIDVLHVIRNRTHHKPTPT